MSKKFNLNLVMQGKGGVGKSLISNMLMQYYMYKRKVDVIGFDVDAEQNTLSEWFNNKVITVDIVNPELDDIDKDKFYDFVELVTKNNNKNIAVDVGTSISKSFLAFLKELNVLTILNDLFNINVFSIVTADENTVKYLKNIFAFNQPAHVFKNEYFGEVNYDTEYTFFKLHDLNKRPVKKVLENKIHYTDINNTKNLHVIEKAYASYMYKHYFDQFDKIFQAGE
ncbi:hypothetical protein LF845_06140 [Deferribacterales bacterium Es71-Z0220]|uniref:nucleotide-binding protein n=1 Tax=Deferrivibrio essentukiensis TaxID=2880922 RepID=UPI001F6118F5|nr:hypothetical protein [Deferrivibrio essentukiensis]MCB4204537.1 hypothetical protein [Deferrivibrio essentukiensis]